jgi:hypothetical protein
MENAALIRRALCSMFGRPRDDEPYVIIQHDSGKFVQFAGSAAELEPLVLDLPWEPMSEAEFYKAAAYFKKHAVVGAELEMFDVVEKKPYPQFGFYMTFRSVDLATEVALEIFEQVYNLPRNVELAVTTSWET